MKTKNVIFRVYVEKQTPYDIKAKALFHDLKENLLINNLEAIRVIIRYDISGITKDQLDQALYTVFAEPALDIATFDQFEIGESETAFATEYLPGQFDQRADSAAQCLQLINQEELPQIRTARVIVLKGCLNDDEIAKIKAYCINPVDSREASMDKQKSLEMELPIPPDIEIIQGFINIITKK